MNISKKIWYLSLALITFAAFVSPSFAQDRDRVVRTTSSRPLNAPATETAPKPEPVSPSVQSRPVNRPPLLQNIEVNSPAPAPESLVKKTASSKALNSSAVIASRSIFSSSVTSTMQKSIFSKLGIPYLYGSSGPNRYDCSGFVWAVFGDAGMNFVRSSARSLWGASEPVAGDERFRFGTLVFLNGLGHMGIVADENGFYHASSSKGITYSPFKGYWEKRIVGFRRLNLNAAAPTVPTSDK